VLRRLRIENLVLIREAELELGPGVNAVTGETGAGKTILAQAIGLLLGASGDAGYLGPGAEEAYVEAELDLPDGILEDEELAAIAELRPEGEEGLVAARRVFADGRTRAYAWGRAVAREDLARLVERLIAMSGQFEQRRLARPSVQLDTHLVRSQADQASQRIRHQVGSGSLPGDRLPSFALAIRPLVSRRLAPARVEQLSRMFRGLPVPLIGRVHDGVLYFDLRCLDDEERLLAQLGRLPVHREKH